VQCEWRQQLTWFTSSSWLCSVTLIRAGQNQGIEGVEQSDQGFPAMSSWHNCGQNVAWNSTFLSHVFPKGITNCVRSLGFVLTQGSNKSQG